MAPQPTARPPSPLLVTQDRAGLDLDRQEAELGVRDDDVRLALAVDAVVADHPGQVLEEDELAGEGGAQKVVDVALGPASQSFGGGVRLGCAQGLSLSPVPPWPGGMKGILQPHPLQP